MRDSLANHFAEQLKSIIEEYEKHRLSLASSETMSTWDPWEIRMVHALIAKSRAAVERASGGDSEYSRQIKDILAHTDDNEFVKLPKLIGVVESLTEDIEAGYLSSASELLHGEIFGDFLEMADHLLGEGFKDAAAVIVGGTLESHLRQLCVKNGLSLEVNDARGVRPKRADSLNSDLANANAISRLDQKNVTAWLDLRNKAAHARYDEYTEGQVKLLVAGVRDFLLRHPA